MPSLENALHKAEQRIRGTQYAFLQKSGVLLDYLLEGRFLAKHGNVILIGGTGTGKTHLAVVAWSFPSTDLP